MQNTVCLIVVYKNIVPDKVSDLSLVYYGSGTGRYWVPIWIYFYNKLIIYIIKIYVLHNKIFMQNHIMEAHKIITIAKSIAQTRDLA